MLLYFIRIFERHGRRATALAIFTGADAKAMPAGFYYECLGTQLIYKYNRLSILDYSDSLLYESVNPFAVVIQVARAALLERKRTPEQLLDEKVLIAKQLFARGFARQKIQAIFASLDGYIRLKKPGLNSNFKKRIESHDKRNIMGIDEYLKQVGMEKGLAKGIKKGKEEGRKEERLLIVRNLLTQTDFDNDQIASLANLSSESVRRLRAEMQSK